MARELPSISGRWSYQAVLPADPRSASTARGFVSHRLAEHDLQHLVDDVRLVASELATHVVLHARRPFVMDLRGEDGFVVLRVRDSRRAAPVQDPARALRARGRGLSVVDGVTHDWGIDRRAGAKGVWATFEVRPENHARRAGGARLLRLSS